MQGSAGTCTVVTPSSGPRHDQSRQRRTELPLCSLDNASHLGHSAFMPDLHVSRSDGHSTRTWRSPNLTKRPPNDRALMEDAVRTFKQHGTALLEGLLAGQPAPRRSISQLGVS